MKHSLRRITVGLMGAATVALAVMAAPAGATAISCGTQWGSRAKQGSPVASTAGWPEGRGGTTSIRAGRHACFDRVVFDGQSAFNEVGYVKQVTRDPQGAPVALLGGAFLHVGLYRPGDAPAYRGSFPGVRGFSTARQVAAAGGFEGYESFGIGVRARLPFRVFVVDARGSHPRVVVDIAHRW